MNLVLLRHSENAARAPDFMAAHKEWIQAGLDDGVILLVGGLKPKGGGLLLTTGRSGEELAKWVNEDPFVEQDIVTPEIVEFTPTFANGQLSFLMP